VSYESRQLDDNHQLLQAMNEDRGLVVWLVRLVYRLHNRLLATLIRRS
jgi:hypothetical protein